jgi:hypothetical protein
MGKVTNRNSSLEDEWYQVRYSGEIPEIALHSSIHHLTEDKSGPGIVLAEEELHFLLNAAKERYLEIILRDITPTNRDTSAYRGVLRTICNWRRFKRFCDRHRMEAESIRDVVVNRFLSFLEVEIEEVKRGERHSCMNCGVEEIICFSEELGFSVDHLRDDLERICGHG